VGGRKEGDSGGPFPETSATVAPLPSLNAYPATRPFDRAAADPPGQPDSARTVRVRVRTYGENASRDWPRGVPHDLG